MKRHLARRRFSLAAALATAVILGAAGSRAAVLIDFEEGRVQTGAFVTTQYCNTAATNQGVRFLEPAVVIEPPGSVPTASQTHALSTDLPGGEFVQAGKSLRIAFTTGQTIVSMKIGADRTYAFAVTAQITAYSTPSPDPAGRITSRPVLLDPGTSITQPLSVASAAGDIRSVELVFRGPRGEPAFEVIDDLSFDQANGVCVSDTTGPSVRIDQPATDGITVFPTMQLGFTTSDAESGIAKVEFTYFGNAGGEITRFIYCALLVHPHAPSPRTSSVISSRRFCRPEPD